MAKQHMLFIRMVIAHIMKLIDSIKSMFAGNDIKDVSFLASNAYKNGDFELAVKHFITLKKILPQGKYKDEHIEDNSYMLADCLRKIERLDEAENEIKIAYSLNNKNENIALMLSWIKMDKTEFQLAKELLDEVIALNPKFSGGYFYRGVCLGELKKYEMALQDFKKSIEIDPESEEGYYNVGYTYHRLENYDKAICFFDKAININPLYFGAYVSRGNSKVKLGKTESACLDFHQALELGETRVQENINEFCNK